MAVTVHAPPADLGQRLVPTLVDEIAATDPTRILYSVPKSKIIADGFTDISAKEFAHVVDRCAWYLKDTLGEGQDFPTLAYLGMQDVMYAVLVLASVKAGYKLLLNSPRNTLEAHLSLFEKTDCNTFLLPPKFPLPIVKQILDVRPMRVVEIPPFQHWASQERKPFPYTKTFAEARSEPFVVLHTSGSTGMPKPIVQSHGTLAPLDAYTALPSQGQVANYPAMCAGTRVYLAFPLFHCAGVSMMLPASIYAGFTIVFGPFPPSADVVNAIHVHGNVQHSTLPPMTLIDLVKVPEYLENLGLLEQITYGGGPCPTAVGDLIAKKTKLLNCLGTTECGVLPVQLCDHWSYMSVSPALGHEYRLVSGDLYEQVIVRKPELDLYQGIFQTFPDLQEWPMKDLYSKHPTHPNQWLYRGRVDDIIVYSTGEKLNAVDMEAVIGAHPLVSAALVAGQGRFQSSLLLEVTSPSSTQPEIEKLINEIWPSVEAANELSPSHGRIHRNMILFTSAEKPMLRAGKGTVQRKLTLDLYEPELEALYKASELPVAVSDRTAISTSSQDTPEEAIKAILGKSTNIDVNLLNSDSDLFEYGLDSLQVTVIAREISQHLASTGNTQSFDVRVVYANPSIAALTAILSRLLGNSNEEKETPLTAESLYHLNSNEIPLSARPAQPKPAQDHVVLLTGSTGTLGSYILDALQRDESVSHIYCLNRGPNSHQRQEESQSTKGLSDISDKLVTFLDVTWNSSNFGLSEYDFLKLLNEVTHIIHNAWQVDFNLSLTSFANQVKIVRHLTEFSVHSRFGAQIVFISTPGAVSGRQGEEVEERIYEDWGMPDEMGYGQSKFVSERLLHLASKKSKVLTTVCRLAQMAGPTTEKGVWPIHEWFPSLILSSKYLGKLPATLGSMERVDWVPSDVAGQSVVELAKAPTGTIGESGASVFHVVSPKTTTWTKELLPIVRKTLGAELEVVPLQDWVAALRDSVSKTDDLARNPAVKLISFYETLVSLPPVVLETKKTVGVSPSIANLEPINASLMENWLRQWGFE